MLGSCINSTASSSLRQTECYKGTPGKGGDSGVALSIWALMVVFSFLSGIGYAVHAAMAWQVHQRLKWKRDEGVEEVRDPEEEERKKKKAHDMWIKMSRMDQL